MTRVSSLSRHRWHYWLEDHGQSRADAYEFVAEFGDMDPDVIVADIAADFHHNHDGWESHWPITFSIARADSDEVHRFEVDREAVPHFYARRKE